MFTSSVGRVVRSTCTANPAPSITTVSLAAIRPLSHCAHQRRLSSSKTSVPPDGSAPDGSKRIAPTQQTASAAGRSSSRKNKEAKKAVTAREIPFSKQYPNLPSVKPNPHLKLDDVALSSFFALHRPISVHNALPESTSEAQFDALFQPKVRDPKRRYDDVIFTLGGAIQTMEGGFEDGQETANDPFAQHLDGAPFDDMLSHLKYRPFRPPPPPVPQDGTQSEYKEVFVKAHTRKQKRKSWSTTIVVTEYINPDGEKEYRAKSSPIVRLPVTENANVEEPSTQAPFQQPFLERMRTRQERWQDYRGNRGFGGPVTKPSMLLISVKRQRKLKMKKHKYKKLMKRTRNLRKKLGKL